MIIVPTHAEAKRVLDKLKELHDAGSHNYDYQHDRETLAATHVVALDIVAEAVSPDQLLTVRLDDLPASTIQAFARPSVTPAFVARVKAALEEAHAAAAKAAHDFVGTAKKNSAGHVLDVCGFSHLVLYSPQSPVATRRPAFPARAQ